MANRAEQSAGYGAAQEAYGVNSDACIAPDFDIDRVGIIPNIVDRYFTGYPDTKAGEFEKRYMSGAVIPLQAGDYRLSYIPNRTRVQKELLYLRDQAKSLDAQSCWEASYAHTEKMREVGTKLLEKAVSYGLVEPVSKRFIRKNLSGSRHSLQDKNDVERLIGNLGWKVIAATNGDYMFVAKVGKKLSYFNVDQLAQYEPSFLKNQLKTYYMHDIYGHALRSAAVDKAFHEPDAAGLIPQFIQEISHLDEDASYHEYKNITHVLEWFDRVDWFHRSKSRSREWVLELHGLDVSRNWHVTNADNSSLFSLSQALGHLGSCDGIPAASRAHFSDIRQWLHIFDHLEYGMDQKAEWVDNADIARFDRPRPPTKEELANTRAYIQAADDFRVTVQAWLQGRESRHTAYDLLGLLRDVRPEMAKSFNRAKEVVQEKTKGTAHSFHSLMADVERRLSPPFYTPLTVESVRTIVKKEFEKAGIQSLEAGGSYTLQEYGELGLAMQDILGWVALEQARDQQNQMARSKGNEPPAQPAIDAYLRSMAAYWQDQKSYPMEGLLESELRAVANHKFMVRELRIDERALSDACDSDRKEEPYPEWQLMQLAYLIRKGKLDLNSRVVAPFLSSFFPWLTGREYSWLLKYSRKQ